MPKSVQCLCARSLPFKFLNLCTCAYFRRFSAWSRSAVTMSKRATLRSRSRNPPSKDSTSVVSQHAATFQCPIGITLKAREEVEQERQKQKDDAQTSEKKTEASSSSQPAHLGIGWQVCPDCGCNDQEHLKTKGQPASEDRSICELCQKFRKLKNMHKRFGYDVTPFLRELISKQVDVMLHIYTCALFEDEIEDPPGSPQPKRCPGKRPQGKKNAK